MNTITLHIGDVRDVMARLADASVDHIVTSPPFLALRSYLPADHPDKAREIGSEATPAAYLDTLLDLTQEWRRLLTPTGSLCVEIGDTYSGSGGGGGDYDVDGWRDGQQRPPGSGLVNRGRKRAELGIEAPTRDAKGPGWPLAKSLCGIPTLYTWSLAYGHNLLNPDHRFTPWRIRNLLTWTRPNPPVGALGDKFRPATSFVTVACDSDRRWFDLDAVRTGTYSDSYAWKVEAGQHQRYRQLRPDDGSVMTTHPAGPPPLDWQDDNQPDWRVVYGPDGRSYVTVACTSDKRWFDLDAVRTEHKYDDWQRARNGVKSITNPARNDVDEGFGSNPAGAPPLDWQDDPHPDWQPLHNLPTHPFRGWATTDRRVPCGPDDGGERTTSPDCPVHADQPDQPPTAPRGERAATPSAESPHTPRSADRHDAEPPHGSAPTDRHDAPPTAGDSSDSTLPQCDPAATPHGTGSNRTDPAPSTNPPDTPYAETLGRIGHTPTSPSSAAPHPDTPESRTAADGSVSETEPDTARIDGGTSSACTCSYHKVITERTSHYATFNPALPRRLIEAMCPREVCTVCGEPRRRVSQPDADAQAFNVGRRVGRATLDLERPPNLDWGDLGAALFKPVAYTTLGWSNCTHDFTDGFAVNRVDYRPGIVFDPFAGSGTTAIAAASVGRDCVLIDLDHRNVELIRQRIAENFRIISETVDGDTYTWQVEAASKAEVAAIQAGQETLW